MTLTNGFPGHKQQATFADVRRDLEGAVVRDAAGKIRAGVFFNTPDPIVTGRTDMRLNIADFRAVLDRGGAIFLANNGPAIFPPIGQPAIAPPSANRRIDLLYVTQKSTNLADATSGPEFGIVTGVASATPVAPMLPANLAGALVLAQIEIPAGATSTSSTNPAVVITQMHAYTAMAGGEVYVRNLVELEAWTPADGASAYCLSNTGKYVRTGGAWTAEDTGWIYPTVTAGTNHATQPVRYRRLQGVTWYSGMWQPTANNQVAFKLPPGFCPLVGEYRYADRSTQVRMVVAAAGNVTYIGPGGDGYVFMSSITPTPADQ